MFLAATHYALQQRLPLVYLAANSGARVGLAQEVKQRIQVWCMIMGVVLVVLIPLSFLPHLFLF